MSSQNTLANLSQQQSIQQQLQQQRTLNGSYHSNVNGNNFPNTNQLVQQQLDHRQQAQSQNGLLIIPPAPAPASATNVDLSYPMNTTINPYVFSNNGNVNMMNPALNASQQMAMNSMSAYPGAPSGNLQVPQPPSLITYTGSQGGSSMGPYVPITSFSAHQHENRSNTPGSSPNNMRGLAHPSTNSASNTTSILPRPKELIDSLIGPHRTSLFVGNLSFFCSDDHLTQLFSSLSVTVLSARIRRDKQGKSLLHGVVMLTVDQTKADEIIALLNGQRFMGRDLR